MVVVPINASDLDVMGSALGSGATIAIVRAGTPVGLAFVEGFTVRGAKVLPIDQEPDAERCMDIRHIGGGHGYQLDMANAGHWRQLSDDLDRRLENIDLLIVIVGSDARGVAPVPDSPYDWLDAKAYQEFMHEAGSAALTGIFELLPAIAAARGHIVLVAPHAARQTVTSNPLAMALSYGLFGMVTGLAEPLERLQVRIAALTSANGRPPAAPMLMSMIDHILATGETGRCWVADEFVPNGDVRRVPD